MSHRPSPIEVYQFRISLRGISPMIWRRVLVRSDSTLADLHYTIQVLMEWSNYYLHQFLIYGRHYAVPRLFGAEADDAEEVHLSDLKLRVGSRFLYEYSFFEWWQHDIRLEKKLALDERKTYPVCIAGERAAPPQDCGGAVGYMQRLDHYSSFYMASRLLEIFQQIQDGEWTDEDTVEEDRAELRQILYWLEAAKLDRKCINQRLKWYAKQDERWTEGLEVL